MIEALGQEAGAIVNDKPYRARAVVVEMPKLPRKAAILAAIARNLQPSGQTDRLAEGIRERDMFPPHVYHNMVKLAVLH